MENLHQKLYATLVGRIDTAVSCLEEMIEQQTFDWVRTIQVTEMLKSALLEAEELYISVEKSISLDNPTL